MNTRGLIEEVVCTAPNLGEHYNIGLTNLAIVDAGVSDVGNMNLCPYTQYPWSNISRGGGMYALQINHTQGQPLTDLVFGSLNGGSPTIFAYISDGTQLSIVGWTTM